MTEVQQLSHRISELEKRLEVAEGRLDNQVENINALRGDTQRAQVAEAAARPRKIRTTLASPGIVEGVDAR